MCMGEGNMLYLLQGSFKHSLYQGELHNRKANPTYSITVLYDVELREDSNKTVWGTVLSKCTLQGIDCLLAKGEGLHKASLFLIFLTSKYSVETLLDEDLPIYLYIYLLIYWFILLIFFASGLKGRRSECNIQIGKFGGCVLRPFL